MNLELTVMMYHYVRDPGDAAEAGSGIFGMSTEVFERQLDELGRQHAFVSWPQVRDAIQGKKSLPGSACLLTFDDGVCDHYLNAFRILQSRKLSGLFFALDRCNTPGITLPHKIHFLLAKLGLVGLREAILEKLSVNLKEQFAQAEKYYQSKYPPISLDRRINLLKAVLQRDLSREVDSVLSELFEMHIGSENEIAGSYYLSMEQIREMTAGGMHFGGHTRSHPWFDWIDAETRAREIQYSAEWLADVEAGPWAFAYPYGGLADDAPQLLEEAGFLAAFTTQTQLRHSDPYYIGRLDGEEMAEDGQTYG